MINITTEEGYENETYNENKSSKRFKLTNSEKGYGIKIFTGDFKLNRVEDDFLSYRYITILSGIFEI